MKNAILYITKLLSLWLIGVCFIYFISSYNYSIFAIPIFLVLWSYALIKILKKL